MKTKPLTADSLPQTGRSGERNAVSRKLLIICGPTATGKTTLALQLAKASNGELLSADSRQVYQYMDVVTGKDIPKNFRSHISDLIFEHRNIPYFSDGKIRIWGYDVVRPDEEWSVKLFQEFAQIIIADMYRRGKLPIVIGGTGLYLKALTEPMPYIEAPRIPPLRRILEKKSTEELFELLSKQWPTRARAMNESDRKNPRRLIRALEIAELGKDGPWRTPRTVLKKFDALWIGLTVHRRPSLYRRIDQRVDRRIGPLLWKELLFLKKKDLLRAAPAQTIGYRQLIPYMTGQISKEEAIQQWKFAEHDYARRQLVWFKKQRDIHWFDISAPDYHQQVVSHVRQWYDRDYARRQ